MLLLLYVHCHDWISSNEFKRNTFHVSSVMIVTQKCSDTVKGLELFVCLSTGLRCSLKRSLSSAHTMGQVAGTSRIA